MKSNKSAKNQVKQTKILQKSFSLIILFGFLASLSLPMALKAKFEEKELNSAYLSVVNNKKEKQLVIGSARDISPRMVYEPTNKPDAVIRAIVTAYTSTPDQTDDSPFIAATGKRVYDGMIAANNLPFGTKIKLPEIYGDKVFTVDDRMNARYGLGKMDVWMDAPRQEALQFGVKYVDAEIYYPKYTLVRK